VRIFRLCKKQYFDLRGKGRDSASVLSGAGGLESGGRWHTEGRRIVYCSTSEALAVLEVRVHVGRFIPRAPFVMHEIAVPDDLIHTLAHRDLPTQWNSVPHSPITQAKGDAWLAKAKHLALRVPSVHSQHDWTVLINPEHEAAQQVRVVARRAYRFDPRLFERP
jgi:RES domain-containing protein